MNFDALPIEINQAIGASLEDDSDLATYRLICRATNEAIDYDQCSFWRSRFLATFDPPPRVPTVDRLKTNKLFRAEYKNRMRGLREDFVVMTGTTHHEKMCLDLISTLIIEAFNPGKGDRKGRQMETKNMEHVRKVVKAHRVLDSVLRRNWPRRLNLDVNKPNPLLLAVQLALTHLSLTAESESRMAKSWGFAESKRMVYATTIKEPIFKGPSRLEVNLQWCLHVANFFKFYLLGKQELPYQFYKDLESTERPQCWDRQITNPARKPGEFWKGSYAFVTPREIQQIRSGRGDLVQDSLNGEHDPDGFQSLRLKFPEANDQDWPPVFEQILRSCPKAESRTTTRAQKRATGPNSAPSGEPVSFRFEGKGEDNKEDFLAQGWLNPLPKQHGIPGWQRMTMMKYWKDEFGVLDMESLWAYEGVVLPGGMIMLGRWWHPSNQPGDEQYSGPFILWNVDANVRTNGTSKTE